MKSGEQSNHKKRAFCGIATVGLSVIFIFFVAEIVTRVIGYTYHIDFRVYMKELTSSDRLPRELFVAHPVFYGAPFIQALSTTSDFSVIYKLNSQGWRDDEHGFCKPLGKKRMLVSGDSFTFGEGIEKGERFVDIVAQHFPCMEMINTALPGYGLDQILVSFLEKGSFYEVDYVVVFLNRSILERNNLGLFRDGKLTLKDIGKFNPLKQSDTLYLDRNSRLFKERRWWASSYFLSFMRYRIALFQLNKKLQQLDGEIWSYLLQKQKPVLRSEVSSLSDDQHNRSVALMEVFYKACQQKGVKLILVNINWNILDLSFLMKKFPDIFYFDFSGELSQQGHLSFAYDRHYNPLTHRFIAARLIEIFKKFAICGSVE